MQSIKVMDTVPDVHSVPSTTYISLHSGYAVTKDDHSDHDADKINASAVEGKDCVDATRYYFPPAEGIGNCVSVITR